MICKRIACRFPLDFSKLFALTWQKAECMGHSMRHVKMCYSNLLTTQGTLFVGNFISKRVAGDYLFVNS